MSGEGQPARPAKDAIPSKYNQDSELTAEVKPGSNTNVDFALESK